MDRGDHQWFALRVRSQREKLVAASLRARGYEEFLPLYRTRRLWSDRVKELHVPLFPGYVFSRFDVLHRLPILTTPGVMHVVGTGKTPIPVDDAEIEALKTLVRSRLQALPWPFQHVGQRVRIACGPLSGVEGVLLAVKKPARLVLSVTLLQRSVVVNVAEEWVLPVEPHTVPVLVPDSQSVQLPDRSPHGVRARDSYPAL
jgi:transcription antitermination factor NusG